MAGVMEGYRESVRGLHAVFDFMQETGETDFGTAVDKLVRINTEKWQRKKETTRKSTPSSKELQRNSNTELHETKPGESLSRKGLSIRVTVSMSIMRTATP